MDVTLPELTEAGSVHRNRLKQPHLKDKITHDSESPQSSETFIFKFTGFTFTT